jgi:hypothetical protein
MTSTPRGTRNAKLLIGYARVFLQVGERQGRFAPLTVDGHEAPKLEGLLVNSDHEVLVLRLGLPGGQLQCHCARLRALLENGGEVPHDFAFARQEHGWRRGRILRGDVGDDDLTIVGDIGIDLPAVGHELLALWLHVHPSHQAWLLDGHGALLACLRAQNLAAVRLNEVRGEIANAVVTLLQRPRDGIGRLRGLCLDGDRRESEQQKGDDRCAFQRLQT